MDEYEIEQTEDESSNNPDNDGTVLKDMKGAVPSIWDQMLQNEAEAEATRQKAIATGAMNEGRANTINSQVGNVARDGYDVVPPEPIYVEVKLLPPSQYDSVSSPMNGSQSDAVSAQMSQSVVAQNDELPPNNAPGQYDAPDLTYRGCLNKKCVLIVGGLIGATVLGAGGTTMALYFLGLLGAAKNRQDDNAVPVTPTAPPKTPTGVRATARDEVSVLVAWDPVEGATGYIVTRVGQPTATLTSASQFSYLDTGLMPGTKYCYTVAATNEKGSSDPSASVCTTTMVAPPTIPSVPTNLTGTAKGPGTMLLMWAASATAQSYTLKRRLATDIAGNGTPVATIPATADPLAYTDTGLTQSTGYCYTIAATNAAGTSDDSGFVCQYTYDPWRILADKIVDQWNRLDEPTFWAGYTAWVKSDMPSIDCQWNVAMYAYRIADKVAPAVLMPESAIADQATAMAALFLPSKNVLPIYNSLATLGIQGTQINRYEKLNVLARALALITVNSQN